MTPFELLQLPGPASLGNWGVEGFLEEEDPRHGPHTGPLLLPEFILGQPLETRPVVRRTGDNNNGHEKPTCVRVCSRIQLIDINQDT